MTKRDFIPQQDAQEEGCKMEDQKVTSKSVAWKMICNQEGGKSVSQGKIFYRGSTAQGEIKVYTQGMNMLSKISGKRIGKCNK